MLLEEYGHYIDAQLNSVETIGDEGEIFADLVQGKSINPAAFTEDDTNRINIDGNWITVEQAAGDLDPSFSDDGLALIRFEGITSFSPNSMIAQSDGKILVMGIAKITGKFGKSENDIVIIRYNSDGTLDEAFANNIGLISTDLSLGADYDVAYSMGLQSDGKIVIAGEKSDSVGISDTLIIRFNSDGSPDQNFGVNGLVITDFGNIIDEHQNLIIQPDNKILIAGKSDSFSSDDRQFLARYNPDGTLDIGFDSDGKVFLNDNFPTEDSISNILLQPDGKIIVGTTTNNSIPGIEFSSFDFTLLRYNTNGSLDRSFGEDGIVITNITPPSNNDIGSSDFLGAIALQPDGKIIAVGQDGISDGLLTLVRYNNDGGIDNSFGQNGIVSTDLGNYVEFKGVHDVVLQNNGKILVTVELGNQNFVLVRYNSNGTADTTFGGGDGFLVTPVNASTNETLALQEDGKILVAGKSNNSIGIARFLGDFVPVFNAAQYGASYADLITGIGYNLDALTQHYQNSGKFEGRQQDLFDEYRYIASNADLIGAFGLNGPGATYHYITSGYYEGRSLTNFIPSRYLLSQGDLLNFYGTDTQAATQHYITSGATEGRNPNLFPSDRYIASYKDLIEGFRYNLEAGSNHYLFSGRGEGRQVLFNPQSYLNRYGDLQAAFGNDLNAATAHYITNGFNEGRTWM